MDASPTPWAQVGAEIGRVLHDVDPDIVAGAADFFGHRSGRWFFTGQGRSGLMARMAATRFMHLGRPVHVVGEASAPSVDADDHLVAFSRSGSIATTLHLARLAQGQGADVLAVCAERGSELARLADRTLLVPMGSSVQFGGSLFEQCALILCDAVVLELSGGGHDTYVEMHGRHANLE